MAMKIFCICILFVWSGIWCDAKEKPSSREEAQQQFNAVDVKLNKAYQAIRAELTPAQFSELQKLQREWLSYRDEKAKQLLWFNERIAEDTPQQCETHAEYWRYKTTLTKDRVEFLQIYSGKDVPEGITGAYQDFHDGNLQLTKTKDRILFQMFVVRGPTAHTGEIEGVAELKGNVGVYRALVPDDPEKKWCEITFAFKDGHMIEVRTKNAQYYGGMGVYFDGTYYKTCGPLIMENSISPDESYGVQVPVICFSQGSPSDDTNEGEAAQDELVEMNTGRVIGTIDVGKEDWRVGYNRPLNFHETLPARWSRDSSLLIWEVAGKWFSDALTVVKLDRGKIQWQLNVVKRAQEAILARAKKAAPQQYADSRKANGGNGSAYPEGFSVGVQVLDPVKLPLQVRVRMTDNPKGGSKLDACMEAIITTDGKFVVQKFRLGTDKLWKDGNNPGGW